MSTIVQSMWIGTRLSTLERLSINSFLATGHEYHLFLYADLEGVPDGVVVKDANSIIPERELFTVKGSYAAFADWFRHKLVSQTGQFWVDTDIVALREFDFGEDHVFGMEDSQRANPAVMRFPVDHPLSTFLADICERPNTLVPYDTPKTRTRKLIRKYLLGNRRGNIKWGEAGGPVGFTRALEHDGLLSRAKPFTYFHPIHYHCWSSLYDRTFENAMHRFDGSYSIHLWNEWSARGAIDKDATFDAGSLIEQLKRKYL
jgi:hypothetical protein